MNWLTQQRWDHAFGDGWQREKGSGGENGFLVSLSGLLAQKGPVERDLTADFADGADEE
jgi:hypothetical protein